MKIEYFIRYRERRQPCLNLGPKNSELSGKDEFLYTFNLRKLKNNSLKKNKYIKDLRVIAVKDKL